MKQLLSGFDDFEAALSGGGFLTGYSPSAADIWLYPLLGWIARALDTTADPVPRPLMRWFGDRPALAAWQARFGQLPGVAATTPPHWQETPRKST